MPETTTYTLYVVADSNDGDCLTKETAGFTLEQIQKFLPLIEAIEKARRYNWYTADRYEEVKSESDPSELYPQFKELVEEFDELVPWGEYGVHTITEIYYIPSNARVSLL
jgi:hypothetical protein